MPASRNFLKAWVFVACLPWSQRTFAEAFPDMGEESWAPWPSWIRPYCSGKKAPEGPIKGLRSVPYKSFSGVRDEGWLAVICVEWRSGPNE